MSDDRRSGRVISSAASRTSVHPFLLGAQASHPEAPTHTSALPRLRHLRPRRRPGALGAPLPLEPLQDGLCTHEIVARHAGGDRGGWSPSDQDLSSMRPSEQTAATTEEAVDGEGSPRLTSRPPSLRRRPDRRPFDAPARAVACGRPGFLLLPTAARPGRQSPAWLELVKNSARPPFTRMSADIWPVGGRSRECRPTSGRSAAVRAIVGRQTT